LGLNRRTPAAVNPTVILYLYFNIANSTTTSVPWQLRGPYFVQHVTRDCRAVASHVYGADDILYR
jgi:hypothetical protein